MKNKFFENTLRLPYPENPRLGMVMPTIIDYIEIDSSNNLFIKKTINFPEGSPIEKEYKITDLGQINIAIKVLSGDLCAQEGLGLLGTLTTGTRSTNQARLAKLELEELLTSILAYSKPGNIKIRYITSSVEESLWQEIDLMKPNTGPAY